MTSGLTLVSPFSLTFSKQDFGQAKSRGNHLPSSCGFRTTEELQYVAYIFHLGPATASCKTYIFTR